MGWRSFGYGQLVGLLIVIPFAKPIGATFVVFSIVWSILALAIITTNEW